MKQWLTACSLASRYLQLSRTDSDLQRTLLYLPQQLFGLFRLSIYDSKIYILVQGNEVMHDEHHDT